MSSMDNHSLKQTTTFSYLTKFNGMRSKSLKIQQVIYNHCMYIPCTGLLSLSLFVIFCTCINMHVCLLPLYLSKKSFCYQN